MSAALPAVRVSAKGRPTTSVSACSLVVWPPRDGPMA